MENLKVLPSDIHGVGLFSLAPIPKNTKITEYIGDEMTLKEFKERYGPYKENCLNTYRMKRQNKIIVAKNYIDNLVNYVNESKEPNCILKNRALYSLRDIDSREELTIAYPKDYKRDWDVLL
jgi:SET domain-containing protein